MKWFPRPRPRKRSLLLLLVLLAGGAIVNIAVAWGCTIILADQSYGWTSLRSGAARLDDGHVWSMVRDDRPGYFRIESGVGVAVENWNDQWEDPRSLIEPWSRIPNPAELGTG